MVSRAELRNACPRDQPECLSAPTGDLGQLCRAKLGCEPISSLTLFLHQPIRSFLPPVHLT